MLCVYNRQIADNCFTVAYLIVQFICSLKGCTGVHRTEVEQTIEHWTVITNNTFMQRNVLTQNLKLHHTVFAFLFALLLVKILVIIINFFNINDYLTVNFS